ncbi:hypothetical protein LCGC14_1627250 [marine sediment metagenome]|uniref:Uncharacterized protein n=1 Tax=marine sediment metagenome TaxID=412755 RepID=A0A0F9I405_9ZZZZ
MKTCEEHDGAVVVYDEMDCPVCEEIDDLKSEIDDL